MLGLDFSLRLEERAPERVLVSALLAPTNGLVRLDGVALQLHARGGDPLGIRLLLPIAGDLRQPMLSTVELKLEEGVPPGARVVGTAWKGADVMEATVPTDRWTDLELHVRARRRLGGLAKESGLDLLDRAERARLAKHYPWIDEPRVTRVAGEIEAVPVGVPDEVVDALGLDAESAEWLRDLLSEE